MLALAKQDHGKAGDAMAVLDPKGLNTAGDISVYSHVIWKVLTRGDVTRGFELLCENFANGIEEQDIAERVRWAGWKGEIAPYLLDLKGLTIAKVATRLGADIDVDTETIPRVLYTELSLYLTPVRKFGIC